MRLKCSVFILILLVPLLVSCGNAVEQNASTDSHKTVSRYFDALCEGNFEAALSVCAPDSEQYESVKAALKDEYMDSIVGLTSDIDVQKRLKNNVFLNKAYDIMAEGLFKSYQIADKVSEDDKIVIYHVNASKLGTGVTDILSFVTSSKAFTEYYQENQEYVDEMSETDEGTGEILIDFLEKKGQLLTDTYLDAYEEARYYENIDYYVTLEQQEDGIWMITNSESS